MAWKELKNMGWYQIDVVDGKVHGNIIVNANSIEEAEAKVAKMQEKKQEEGLDIRLCDAWL